MMCEDNALLLFSHNLYLQKIGLPLFRVEKISIFLVVENLLRIVLNIDNSLLHVSGVQT
jgi:hypothetical protein